jgi:hypothetical protein
MSTPSDNQPRPDQVVGQTLVGFAHSPYSEPEFVVEGIGPSSFRTHFLFLGNGLVIELFVAEITVSSETKGTMPGETVGIPSYELLGGRIVAVVRDDTESGVVILEGGLFLTDDNDGFYGNPLRAGRLSAQKTPENLLQLVCYWSGAPVDPETLA